MTQALLTDLYRPRPEPARTGFPEAGGPRRVRPGWGWQRLAALLVVLGITAVATRVATTAPEDPQEQAWVSASAAHATTWVGLLARGNGFMAQALSCSAVSEHYADATGATLQSDFADFLGGDLAEWRVDGVDVVDSSYYVRLEGMLEDGDPVEFVVLVIGEDGHWRACGFGAPGRLV